jgi:hypothetical protein
VYRNGVAFQRANAGLSVLLETDPFCHLRPPADQLGWLHSNAPPFAVL